MSEFNSQSEPANTWENNSTDANKLGKNEKIFSSEDLQESTTEKRRDSKPILKTGEETKSAKAVSIPILVKLISILHIIVIGVCFYFVVQNFNLYHTLYKKNEIIDKETAAVIIRGVCYLCAGLLTAYSRALLLENFY